ncbi:triose-phosphate isomerase [Candidatus Berkelbacteria bacterium RIFCSPLOWO2_01_FULL_50_28]|uniref:Triosephosphate isomerase n=1 Tax=Candidatus Berkelbacteria bacterium RIFCSPLOWO2_01_FULL_50_28 TaxID=1797471 RepID=A0A1F5EBH5_9BACT|nr:MAG: triose-phosphate isomerase [Candidatus Berkelbacteria bacterium RIFCSPHIGHO2_01_FULL_50_36]OGD63989.1 MAG: triose-phosphate isomerase [Candidatus Berkelbacteria bacterium RIFCSPHIGHO2_12_FULL_50_11]OGD64701.1 MAG: triose-phosphate isomerase [Candidatus Berkelbacteria bacterium RIFCSPLOWO2_01_FULL_50_28]
MSRRLIVGNWKMYPTLSDALVLTSSLKTALEGVKGVEIALAPPTPWLVPVVESWHHKLENVHFAAQDIWPHDQGAYTGQASAFLLKNLVSYAIVGHSERRSYVGEDNDLINDKVHACLRWGIKPILCVGETKRLLDADGNTDSYQWSRLSIQLMEGLSGIKEEDLAKVSVAYEPVWAVGTKRPATPEYALEVIGRLREKLSEKYPRRALGELRILYGGDVDVQNAAGFMKYPEIDGFLLGREAVHARNFAKVCSTAASL